MSSTNLKQFVNRIFSINPSQANMFAGGSGVGGPGAASLGASATEILQNLRRDTALFAEKYRHGESPNEVQTLMQAIEGELTVLRTLGAISEDLSSELIKELYEVAPQ